MMNQYYLLRGTILVLAQLEYAYYLFTFTFFFTNRELNPLIVFRCCLQIILFLLFEAILQLSIAPIVLSIICNTGKSSKLFIVLAIFVCLFNNFLLRKVGLALNVPILLRKFVQNNIYSTEMLTKYVAIEEKLVFTVQ
jgi:hypothetical protein